MELRSERRLDVEGLPVKTWGMGADSHPFVLNAIAHEVSYRGARLEGLTCKIAAGDIIAVQYGNQKGRFRVVWVADPASDRAGQVGIRSVDDSCIWEAELAEFAQEPPGGEPDPLAVARRDRRQYPRFRCPGNVQFRRPDSSQHIWAKLSDLSLGGCYVDTAAPEPVGTRLHLELHIQNLKISAIGEVRTAVPALGMGVQFTSFEGDSREVLKQLVDKLSPPKLAGRPPQGASPEPAGSLQALLGAVREHFEGNNIMTSQEFEAIAKTLLEKKPPPAPAQAATVKSA